MAAKSQIEDHQGGSRLGAESEVGASRHNEMQIEFENPRLTGMADGTSLSESNEQEKIAPESSTERAKR